MKRNEVEKYFSNVNFCNGENPCMNWASVSKSQSMYNLVDIKYIQVLYIVKEVQESRCWSTRNVNYLMQLQFR